MIITAASLSSCLPRLTRTCFEKRRCRPLTGLILLKLGAMGVNDITNPVCRTFTKMPARSAAPNSTPKSRATPLKPRAKSIHTEVIVKS